MKEGVEGCKKKASSFTFRRAEKTERSVNFHLIGEPLTPYVRGERRGGEGVE